jgi:cyclopropane fatty-acyl-phospholipid synthase-like methyltransferase
MVTGETQAARVRRYYERNTRLFMAFGLGSEARAIHRAVWADDADGYAAALGTVNRRLLGVLASQDRARVLDLGCGVGGTLLTLARGHRGALHALGLTISPTQARIATQHARQGGLAHRSLFVEADFAHAPARPVFDLAVAVESLVHAAHPPRVLGEAAGALRPGGRLVVCDDFLAEGRRGAEAERWVGAFRAGWHAPGLMELPAFLAAAQDAGLRLVEREELTGQLRLVRLPAALADDLIRLGAALPARLTFLRSVVGGLALQLCLRQGVIGYHWLVFER